jgi:ATP adenylyltransferase/5',5'''-P-1,P-4-tetraphosphate phosphorylase II
MNSVSANGYQIVISTSQATARTDVNVATIQVCGTVLQRIQSEFRTLIAKHDPLAILFGITNK